MLSVNLMWDKKNIKKEKHTRLCHLHIFVESINAHTHTKISLWFPLGEG